MAPAITPSHHFDAMLCDLDGMMRFYDASEVSRLEKDLGLRECSTVASFSAEE